MRKISVTLACLLALLCATPASAQFQWGVEGGVSWTKASVKGDGSYVDSSKRSGWFLGPKVQMVMPVIGLGLDASLLYAHKHLNLETTEDGSVSKALPYLEIPINVRYQRNLGIMATYYIATGPQYDWYMGSRNLSSVHGSIGSLDRSTFSWNVGAGITLMGHLQVGVTYSIALGETGQLKDLDGVVGTFDLKANSWQLRVCYLL